MSRVRMKPSAADVLTPEAVPATPKPGPAQVDLAARVAELEAERDELLKAIRRLQR